MFPLVLGQIRTLLALAALGDTSFTRPAAASALEILRFYGFGNETDASQPDSVYRVRQKQLVLAPEVSARLAARLRLGVGPLVMYTHTYSDTGTILTRTGPYYGAGNFGQVGTRAELELDTRDMPVAPARGAHLQVAAEWYPASWDVGDSF